MILTVTANAAIDKRYVVEGFGVGNVNRVKSCVANAGGKGINVSRVASIAGEKVTATGFLGGHAGKFISEHVQEYGIKSEFVWCNGESRTCINIWDEKEKKQTEFLEPGFSVTEEDCNALLEKFSLLLKECRVVTISGSAPKGTGSGLYRKMIEKAREEGKPVILDTSGTLLEDCLLARPTMIKPNIDEIRALTKRPMNTRESMLRAAQDLHDDGIEIVAISLGGDGSLVSCQEGVFDVKVPKIDAVNTVGCGDSMIAGFAVGMSRGLSMEETIRLASAVSAANAMRLETGFIVKEDMERLLPQIRIKKIK
ncbi:MAG TPA: 1-phosphofructokinase [Candidatus Blautia faecigallinarum]|uniref:Tagatose-6-phosphate kinase n=1 Tax=Candidatus Blautia faecigallinarum TaxID=2838488 RepID=A0A9D2IU81_9FIRM|nr:1-phosphofructokinase [Candidatus Blautia faecigallinarum]